MRPLLPVRMSRTARLLTGTALTFATAGLSATALAADFGNVEVNPTPATAGTTVNLMTTACGKNGQATVDAGSLGAGLITLNSKGQTYAQNAQGTLEVPAKTRPGNYAIGGSCSDGKELTGTVVIAEDTDQGRGRGQDEGRGMPENPEAEAGRDAENGLPPETGKETGAEEQPGEHGRPMERQGMPDEPPDGEQAPGVHHRGEAPPPGEEHAAGQDPPMPHGRVDAGAGGGSAGRSAAQLAGGSLAVAAAAGGVLYLRRRHLAGRF